MICADLGKFAIHTTRKRLIAVQRELKKKGIILGYLKFLILENMKENSYFYLKDLDEEKEILL